jgi:hypothetical protein
MVHSFLIFQVNVYAFLSSLMHAACHVHHIILLLTFFQWLLQPLQDPGLVFSSVIIFYTDDRTPWPSDRLVARSLPIHRKTQNKFTHRHPCLWVGFETTIPASERAKTIHTLDRAATVFGPWFEYHNHTWSAYMKLKHITELLPARSLIYHL